ncbi:MAG: hypothetical protein LUD50_02075 [Clostridia bacterium]|nr:hypothetical protein [Clostridia bacterium]
MDVIAFLLAVFSFVADGLFTGKLFSAIVDIARIAAGLLMGSLAIMISTRGDMMGYIWFSALDSNPTSAVSLTMALVSWVFYVLAIVADIASLVISVCRQKAANSDASLQQ